MKDTRDVIGLNVFSVEEGRILGRTTECVVSLASGDVLGLIVEEPDAGEKAIARADITAVGRHAVMVATAGVLKSLEELPEIDSHRKGGPDGPQIITRSGEVLAALGTVRVDEACERVEGYQIVIDVVESITDGPASLPIIDGTIHGRDAVVLPDDATGSVKRPGGLRQSLEKAYGSFVDGAREVGQKVTSAAKKAPETAKSATEAVGAKAKSARDAIEDKVDAAREKAAAKDAPPKAKKAAKKKAPAKAKKKATKKKAAAKKAPKKSASD